VRERPIAARLWGCQSSGRAFASLYSGAERGRLFPHSLADEGGPQRFNPTTVDAEV
jgi:hypothetical protein